MLFVLLPEVLIQAVHGQEVDVWQEHVRCVDLPHGHITQQVDWVELSLFVDDVVADVPAAHQHLGALSVAQELLGLGVGQVQGQADGPLPVLTDGLQHLEPAKGQTQRRVITKMCHITTLYT